MKCSVTCDNPVGVDGCPKAALRLILQPYEAAEGR